MSEESTELLLDRIRRLQEKDNALTQQRNRRKLSKTLLDLLPQGHGSGLDADKLDGEHLAEIIERMRKIAPRGGGGARDYTLEVHGANKHDHTTWFAVITPLGAILPDSGGPAQTKVTGTNFTYYVLDFDKTSAEEVFAQFKLPPNYSPGDDLQVIVQWISTVSSGAVKWGAQILGRADGETFDAALSTEQTATTTTNGIAGKINTTAITVSSPDLVAEDVFILKIRRVAADAADTMDADARLIMAGIKL